MSPRELARLSETGRSRHVIMVVDNLQSGPDAGKGIAEILGAPHVVLTNFPSEEGYPATLEVGGARMVRVAAPAANGFRVDLEALEAAITPRTRALFFATPNNPSGVILSAADLAVIGNLARRHSLWIVADEVYAGLAPGGRVPGLAAAMPDQVATISRLSKSHSMPGWRAGWLVGPRQLIAHAEAMAQCMLFGLPGFGQEAAVTALGVSEAAESKVRTMCALCGTDALLTPYSGDWRHFSLPQRAVRPA